MPPVVPGEEEVEQEGVDRVSYLSGRYLECLHAPISPAAPLITFMSSSSLLSCPSGDSRVKKIIN